MIDELMLITYLRGER